MAATVTTPLKQSGAQLFNRVLFLTDLTGAAERAIPYLLSIGKTFHPHVFVGHIVEPHKEETREAAGEIDAEALRRERKQTIDQQYCRGFLKELKSESLVEVGDPGYQLFRLVRIAEADLVVLATHGYTGFERMLLGSFAEEVFRSISCPVLTVTPSCPKVKKTDFKSILMPTDLSKTSEAALPYALRLAQCFGARLTLVSAVHPDVRSRDERHRISRERTATMEAMIAGASLSGPVDFRVVFEKTRKAILGTAVDIHADLIVMGVRDSGDFTRALTHLPGPTAYEVVARANCPVLTVRYNPAS